MQPKLNCVLACFVASLTLIAYPLPTFADEKPQVDAYASVWESLLDLLRRREYGTAAALLDTLADDPKLRGHGAMIEADKAIIDGLLGLEQTVREQAAKLPEGSRLDIQGIEYSIVKYEKNAKGDELVLRSQASGREYRKSVASLPSSTWMQLAESKLDAVSHPALILGVFAGFDQSSDVKTARKLLNEAGGKGADVSRWLTRLEDAANSRKPAPVAAKAKGDGDPVAGHWRMAIGPDKSLINLELRADGTAFATIPLGMLIEMRKRKMPLPLQNPLKGKWLKNEDGTYQITLAGGATGKLALLNDHLVGRNDKGETITAMRQVKR